MDSQPPGEGFLRLFFQLPWQEWRKDQGIHWAIRECWRHGEKVAGGGVRDERNAEGLQ